jgi:hypothetical protein
MISSLCTIDLHKSIHGQGSGGTGALSQCMIPSAALDEPLLLILWQLFPKARASRRIHGIMAHQELPPGDGAVQGPQADDQLAILARCRTLTSGHYGQLQLRVVLIYEKIHSLIPLAPYTLYVDHTLSLDTQRLELHCRCCKDYVYLETFDEALLVGCNC